MARAREQSVEDLLRDLMIVQLLLAGVGQHQIRQIVGVDIHRVSRIAKLMKRPKE
jgi:transposase-like protein